MWYHIIRSPSFSVVTIHASDRQTDGQTESRQQYRALHYMQSHGKDDQYGPLNSSNSSKLEQLALKGLRASPTRKPSLTDGTLSRVCGGRYICREAATRLRCDGQHSAVSGTRSINDWQYLSTLRLQRLCGACNDDKRVARCIQLAPAPTCTPSHSRRTRLSHYRKPCTAGQARSGVAGGSRDPLHRKHRLSSALSSGRVVADCRFHSITVTFIVLTRTIIWEYRNT